MCQRCVEIFGTGKLLLPVYPELCIDSQTLVQWDWMERQEKVFRELKEKFTKKLVLAASDLDKKNENGSGCIRLCNGWSFVNGV